jgi:hypothetical protein
VVTFVSPAAWLKVVLIVAASAASSLNTMTNRPVVSTPVPASDSLATRAPILFAMIDTLLVREWYIPPPPQGAA